jgi:hypothetical protein
MMMVTMMQVGGDGWCDLLCHHCTACHEAEGRIEVVEQERAMKGSLTRHLTQHDTPHTPHTQHHTVSQQMRAQPTDIPHVGSRMRVRMITRS